jgi:DNA polymerase-1
VPFQSKRPSFADWTSFRLTPDEIDTYFSPGGRVNIGVLLGEPSGGLLDVDLDSREAIAAAPGLLPPTGLVGGRAGARKSHWFYVTEDPPRKASTGFLDPTVPARPAEGGDHGRVLLELRSTGAQTLVPPSQHPSGEPYTWFSFGEPAHRDARDLLRAVARVASAALLARYWPQKGARHSARLALAGGLLRNGFPPDDATAFLEAVTAAARNDGFNDCRGAVNSTLARLENGEPVEGFPCLVKLLGDPGARVVRQVGDWLGLDRRPAPAGAPGPWDEPVPLGADFAVPPFPTDCLPGWLAEWVEAEAEATQTPPDLAAVVALTQLGAALARKFRVRVRPGWTEPTNVFSCVALPPGDRKSAVHADALAPVREFERQEQERTAPLIAEAAAERRLLEARLKAVEGKAARANDPAERDGLFAEAKHLSRELAAHEVPEPPQLYVDDETPENLARKLARQGGRLLQAAAEGTAFEIAKGRYSETANFDIYLKGHAGDPLRVGRVGRPDDVVDDPALSCAFAVQPDVLAGLHGQTSMRGRGFLARWLYALPRSRVGTRLVAAPPVPRAVAGAYRTNSVAVWRLEGTVDEGGRPAPHRLQLSPEADRLMQGFESWLEPQLAEGGELADLAGWAQKLAGAAARIAGILHVARAVGSGEPWGRPVGADTVAAAVRLARNYLLPHARAAFGLMGADERVPHARAVLDWLARRLGGVEDVENVEDAPLCVSRREIHQVHRRRFDPVEKLDPVLDLLVRHGWLRPTGEGRPGRGIPGPAYDVNPAVRRPRAGEPPRTQRTQRPQPGPSTPTGVRPDGGVEDVEYVEYAPETPDGAAGGPADVPPGGCPTDPPARADAPHTTGFVLVTAAADLTMVATAVAESRRVGVDTETTGLDPRTDRVRLLQLATDRGVYLIDLFAVTPDALGPLWEALAGVELVWHNLAFDLQFLARLGFAPGRVFDTQRAAELLHGRQPKGFYTLASVAERELGRTLDKAEQTSDWSGALTPEQYRYAAADAEVLVPLAGTLADRLRQAGQERVGGIEMRAVPALAWMARTGVAFDRDAWLALAAEAEAARDRLRGELDELAPVPAGRMFAGVNWDSPAQVLAVLRQAGVALNGSTDDDTLAACDHPLAALVRDYRAASKRATTYGRDWLAHVAPDGRVYPGWRQIGAGASGRMSCRSPNVQQLPRDRRYRRCFVAPPGRRLVKADYSQIELRIAAKVTGDRRLLEAYRSGDDLHTLTARRVLGKAEVTKADRQIAKSLNFGLLYGMGTKGLRAYARSNYGVELTPEQAEEYRAAFFKAYPGLRRWHNSIPDRPIETQTLAGRRRQNVTKFTEKLNTPVQGTGADGLKTALALLWERRADCPGAVPVLAVHDELVVEVDRDRADAAAAWLRQALLDGMAPLLDPVPVEVAVASAPTWGG